MSKHRKQHFVPASYLKAWADADLPAGHSPFVWVFDKDGGNPRKRAPENIFHEPELYTRTDRRGGRDVGIETDLGRLENKFVRVRDTKLRQREPLTKEEQIIVCAFVAAAEVRTPASRDHQATQWNNVAAHAKRIQASLDEATPEERNAMRPASLVKGPSMSLEQVEELAAKPLQTLMGPSLRSIPPILYRMSMAVLCTTDPVGFITSDCPCHWHDPTAYRRHPLFRAPSLRDRHIEVTMPIAPSMCLLFTWDGPSGYLEPPPLVVAEINRQQRFRATKQYVLNREHKEAYWFTEIPPPADE